MSLDELIRQYGREYPFAVVVQGVRCPLIREGRFMRYYADPHSNLAPRVSRFEDGSATMVDWRLQHEWDGWDDEVRREFAESFAHLRHQDDFPGMVRFLIRTRVGVAQGTIAVMAAQVLPRDEAFALLMEAMEKADTLFATIAQALVMTRHPRVRNVLAHWLDRLSEHPLLWSADPTQFMTAYDVICIIGFLCQIGEDPAQFAGRVRHLRTHPVQMIRDTLVLRLKPYFPWLAAASDN
jgi:hypothetical protein